AHAERAARGHERRPGLRRRADLHAGGPVPGHRHAEPGGALRHLPAAGVADGPLPSAHPDGLPVAGGRKADPARVAGAVVGRAGGAVAGAAGGRRARAAGGCRSGALRARAGRLRGRHRARDAPVAPPGAGRLATRAAGLAERRPGRRAGRRAGLRPARRPQVAGPPRPGPPGRDGRVERRPRAVAPGRRARAARHPGPPAGAGLSPTPMPTPTLTPTRSWARRIARWFKPPRRFPPTREGWWFLIATLLLGLAAINAGLNLLFLVWGMMLFLVLASGVLSELCLRRLEVRRSAPPAVH